MKTRNLLFASLIAGTGLLAGCVEGEGYREATVNVCNADTIVRLLGDDPSSPSCHIKLSFAYLNPYSEKDSISEAVNYTLKQTFFGDLYAKLAPRTFVDTIASSLIGDYRRDVLESYRTDVENGVIPENMPKWYNYDFRITSTLEKGRDSIWNYQMTTFQYTGGAHPNTWSKWVNIDALTGRPLEKDETFATADKAEIRRLILEKIIEATNERLETDTVTSLEGLHANGVLLDEDVFIPENFLLKDYEVTFLYNPYEIAPYYMGQFELHIPNDEILPYLNAKQ